MEVAKLRAKDAHFSEELRHAKTVIQRLQELLASNDVPIPNDILKVNHPMATIELVGKPPFGQSLQAQLPVFDHSAPAPHLRESVSAQPFPSSSEFEANTSTALGSDLAMACDQEVERPLSTHPYGLDSTQVGVNFVLALEHPCLYHHSIPSVPMLAHGEIGYGHSLMLSSPIMEHSPSYSLNPLKMGWPKGTTWNVPAIELDKLLSFSDQIELESEITPVQVWHQVRCHPNFNSLTPERLQSLRDALLPSVKCLGFGAVIDLELFEAELEKATKLR